jgi:hypothetical protein
VTGYMIATGPCFACRRPFPYHPDLVASVLVDPVTGRPPDLGGAAGRARREPVCPSCCRRANPQRAAAGLELLDERDSLDVARELGGP